MKQNIQKAQQICLELLCEVKDVCEANNLTFWIDGGTLLGAKRHRGFIPWDDDVDVCLPIDDYFKLLNLLSERSEKLNNRLLFFHNSDFPFWSDYYASTDYLVDGLLPVRIDLIPVFFHSNDEVEKRKFLSLFQIANLFVRGKFKDEKYILDEHSVFLPQKSNKLSLLAQRTNFLNYFFDFCTQSSSLSASEAHRFVNYVFGDAYVLRERPSYRFDVIFPLESNPDFEEINFFQPNNRDAYLELLYGQNHMEVPPNHDRISHQLFLVENKFLTKNQIQSFIIDLHKLRYLSYDVLSKTGHKKRPFIKLWNFMKFTCKLISKGELRLVYLFWRYNLAHIK